MTLIEGGNLLYVASVRYDVALAFARVNGVDEADVAWIGDGRRVNIVNRGQKIWVIGEIGQEIAESLHICKVMHGAVIKYADCVDIVSINNG